MSKIVGYYHQKKSVRVTSRVNHVLNKTQINKYKNINARIYKRDVCLLLIIVYTIN